MLRVLNRSFGFGLVFLASCVGSSDQGASRLANSESPYLREHADNPVNWYPWGDEAFERARKENKPVIVSVGYSACHWCHVMERESFMDAEVARIMNENFISIKVDREERPDVDQQFVYASQALTGTAGWPLNAFALPDGKPFHTITYYPKDAWIDLLNRVAAAWKDDSDNITKQASDLTKNITPFFEYHNPDSLLRLDLRAFLNHIPAIYSSLDFRNGGVKGSPKFPMPSLLELMLQYSRMTGDKRSMEWVTTTLDAMARGGIHDQIGGGFSRYSTDSLWHVPHFEKMLYDNAQLASVYANAYKLTHYKRYKDITNSILSFVEREMTTPDSAFLSSIDADSEGEEGKYYEWTDDEFRKIFGNEAKQAMAFFGVTKNSKNFLRVEGTASDEDIARWKKRLFNEREQRTLPSFDKKTITSWNAMMIVGLLDGVTVTLNKNHLEMAFDAIHFIDEHMVKDNKVFRSMLRNEPSVEGFLDDYAWLAKAYIHLYQASLDIQWLNKAKKITDLAIEKFKNSDSPFFYYSVGSPNSQLIRNTELFDDVIPSSNSVFAEVMLMLGEYFQDERYITLAENAIKEMVSSIDLDGTSISNWARLAQIVEFGPYEIAIVGERSIVLADAATLRSFYLPATITMGSDEENLPLLENKLINGQTTIYVCRNRICKQPATDLLTALDQITYK